MPKFMPFKAVRPKSEFAKEVSCLPYDVMNRDEAKLMASESNKSFLHVVRSEIDFDDSVSAYDEIVYNKAKENLDKMQEDAILFQDEKPKYYIYRQIMNGRSQTGIVGVAAIDDYLNDIIKKHEYTRVEKEQDRINHFYHCDANTEPVFFTYPLDDVIEKATNDWIIAHKPCYDFVSDDGISHILWTIFDDEVINTLTNAFAKIEYFFIADGHHRSASAAKVGLRKRKEKVNATGKEEFNNFMSVSFPDKELLIMDYNRVVKDLNGNTANEFLEKLYKNFEVVITKEIEFSPSNKHEFGMLLDNVWYKIIAKQGTYDEKHPIKNLDASILQDNLLAPILGIIDPRTDKRIDFVGGIRGIAELNRRCANDMKIAFSLYPVTIADLINVAKTGNVMPPKSTWFEPKLRSGLFIHKLT